MAGCLSIHPQGAAIYALGIGTENGAETGAMAWKAGTDCPRVERVSLVVSEAERKRESMDETITERQWEREWMEIIMKTSVRVSGFTSA